MNERTRSWGGPVGDDYDRRWRELEQSGHNIHGEADAVEVVAREFLGSNDRVPAPPRILDAGCGTGRVAIELARRGWDTVGVDVDAQMLSAAREKAPRLSWVVADLAALSLDDVGAAPFDVVLMAGNVMLFVEPGTEASVVSQVSELLRPRGLLVSGFQLRSPRRSWTVDAYDEWASNAHLSLCARYATWDRAPFSADSDYCVSVHRRR